MPEFDSTIQYRDIPDFPGYKAGNDGSIWTCRDRHFSRSASHKGALEWWLSNNWREMRQVSGHSGRLHLRLCRDNKAIHKQVHRLVLEAFVGFCPKGMECCHDDGNHLNNHLINLRWDTRKANAADKKRHGTVLRGSRVSGSKLTEEDIPEIRRLLTEGWTLERIGSLYGVTMHAIWRIKHRKVWIHV